MLQQDQLDKPVVPYMRRDVAAFPASITVQELLDTIRKSGLGDRILYFYVRDAEDRLVGVIPTRRLLTSDPASILEQIMVRRVAALPDNATVYDVCDLLLTHRYLAVPIVDRDRRLVGVVDVSLLTNEVFDVAEKREAEEVFQIIGVRLAQVQAGGVWTAFRYRAPWLSATLAGGLACVLITGFFEATLQQSISLAMFFALALGLSESVTIQSMTLALQRTHSAALEARTLLAALIKESATAILLGLFFGALVAAVCWLWRGEQMTAISIGISIAMSVTAAALFGSLVPMLLHAMQRDPKVASGPIALAATDAFTCFVYFGLATVLLR